MKKQTNILLAVIFALVAFGCQKNTSINVVSPDGKNTITYNSATHQYQVMVDGKQVVLPSAIKLHSKTLNLNGVFKVTDMKQKSVDSQWQTHLGERSVIPEKYNEIKLFLENNNAKLNLIFRSYDEGVAFAYEIPEQKGVKSLILDQEAIEFNFDNDYPVWAAHKAQKPYRKCPISEAGNAVERPLVLEHSEGLTIALAEAEMINYARMKFNTNAAKANSLVSHLDGKVERTLPFRSPWRVVMTGKDAGQLLERNYLIMNLNPPSAIKDQSWIKPGKVLREGTLTTQGAKACIDFVKAHNMQYVEFDAGWYGPEGNNNSDATTTTLDPKRSKGPFDIEEIMKYAKANDIGILLYVNRRALEKQLDEILPLYQKWGIAGLKYGFVRVGSQDAANWMHEAVRKTAEYKMVVDIHDEYRPVGFSRTYPNLLTQEGIRGDEETIPNSHTLITMFTRMLAGAGDNTICYNSMDRVHKMGSHASQLAKAVCMFSPLQFMYWYDKPASAPEKKDGLWGKTNTIGDEPELEFWDAIPTTWDETKALHVEIGKCGAIARRKGNDWFIGGINGEENSEVEIDFSFLKEGASYNAKIYTDDPSVKTRTHVRIAQMQLDAKQKITMKLKPNNGFAMHISLK
ncbi:alpha-glucosidase [Prolixibacteraceae bacterium JC049]|nr:alpha-glucosidase [Prolixibacteraceae bacterium JC049]